MDKNAAAQFLSMLIQDGRWGGIEKGGETVIKNGREYQRSTAKVGTTMKVRLTVKMTGAEHPIQGDDGEEVFTAKCVESIIESFVTYDTWEVEGVGQWEWYSDHMARAASEGRPIGNIEVGGPRSPVDKVRWINVYSDDATVRSTAFANNEMGSIMTMAEALGLMNYTQSSSP